MLKACVFFNMHNSLLIPQLVQGHILVYLGWSAGSGPGHGTDTAGGGEAAVGLRLCMLEGEGLKPSVAFTWHKTSNKQEIVPVGYQTADILPHSNSKVISRSPQWATYSLLDTKKSHLKKHLLFILSLLFHKTHPSYSTKDFFSWNQLHMGKSWLFFSGAVIDYTHSKHNLT